MWAVAIVAFLVFGTDERERLPLIGRRDHAHGRSSLTAVAGDLSTLNTVIACVAPMALPVVFAKLFRGAGALHRTCLVGTAVSASLSCSSCRTGPVTWALFCVSPCSWPRS